MSSNLQNSVVLITSSIPNVDAFGTGFVVHQDEQDAYVLTCTHVVRAVGGPEKVKVGGIPAVVVASGSEDRIDLAVLRVEGLLDKPSLYLCAIGEKNKAFSTAGFQLYGKRFMIRPLHGILGEQVGVETREQTIRTKAWDLKITDEYLLQPGYSGSPVVDEASGYVMGIVSDRQGEGKKGLAISIEALEEIWQDRPQGIWQDRPPAIKIDEDISPRHLRVFLCHSSDDKPAVRKLYQRLKDCNIDPWLDEKKLLPGQDWDLEIKKAVRACDVVIVCLSRDFVKKEGYGQKEIKLALDTALEKPEDTIYLIPLKLEECELPVRLRHLHAVNFLEEKNFDRLIEALKARRESLRVNIAPINYQTNAKEPSPQLGNTLIDGKVYLEAEEIDPISFLQSDYPKARVFIRQKFSSELELSADLKSWTQPFAELTTGKQQDLSRLFRPEPPELPSAAAGESVEDPQTHPLLPPGVSSRARNKLRPERPPKKLFGRQKLLKEGHRYLLRDELPLLVYGIPGIGKTAFLATLFSDPEVAKKYGKENILWINLRKSGASTLIEIVDEIARGLSYPEVLNEKMELPKLRVLEAALLSDLPQHVIVFDNVDLKPHQGALIRRFQKEISSRIVVGSRAGFALPDVRVIRLWELAPNHAIDAFKSYAQPAIDDDEHKSYTRLTTDDDERIEVICRLIGYHPQAIMIAASTMYENRLSLEELARKLRNKRLELLSQGPEDDFEFNMRVSFGVSYDNLSSASDRHVFDVCGAFAASGAPLAAIAVASGLLEVDCRDSLAPLQSRLLLERDESNPDHYRMHQLLHDFAREKLLKEHESLMRQEGTHFNETPVGRMVSFYVKYAKEHEEDFPALETARDNVLQAAQWAWENESWEAVHDLWEALDIWLDSTGDWSNVNLLQERAIHANRKLQNREIELAKVLASRSTYFELVGQIEAALSDAQESLALGNKVEDPKTIVNGLVRIAWLYQFYLNKYDEGRSNLEQAWSICQGIPDGDQVADVAYRLGHNYWSRGDIDKARKWFQKCSKIARALKSSQLESLRLEAFAVTALGNLLIEQGNYKRARKYLERSRKLKEKVGNRYSIAITISSQADLETAQQNYARAIELHNDALKIYREIGATPMVLGKLRDIGDVYYRQGSYDQAISSYKESMAVGRKVELPAELANTIIGLGRVYEQVERHTEALEVYQQALELLDMEHDPQTYGVVLHDMANVYQAQGQLKQALEYFRRAAESQEQGNNPRGLVITLQTLADVQVELGQVTEAQQVYERCLELLRGLPAPGELDQLARVYHRLGRLHERQEQYEEALEAHLQVLQWLDAEQDPQSYGVELHDIADVYQAQGQLERALDYYQRAAEAKERGENPSDLVTTLQAMADVQVRLGQEAQALHVLEQAMQLLRDLPAPGELAQLAGVLVQLGRIYLAQAQPEGALPYLEEARSLVMAEGVATAEEVLSVLALLATTYKALGRQEEVAQVRAAAQALSSTGQQDEAIASLERQLAAVYHSQGRTYEQQKQYVQALEAYEQALQLFDAEREPQTCGVVLHDIADVYEAQGQLEQALAYYQRAAKAKERGNNPSDLVITLQTLADVQVELGQVTEAQQVYERCLALLRDLPAPGEPDQLASIYHSQGRTYERQKQYAQALEAYEQAVQLLDAEREPQLYGVVLHDIADVYEAQGQLGRALEYYQLAAEAKERGKNRRDLVTTLRTLAEVQLKLGKQAEAVQVYERCLDFLRGQPAPGELAQLAGVLVQLGRIYLAQAQPEGALPYLEEARSLVMAEGVATAEEVLSVLALLATTYKALGRQEEVAQVRVAAQALSSTGQQDEAIASLERQLAAVYHSQGRTYEQQKQYVQALEAYEQALQLFDAEREPQTCGVVLHDIADVYEAQGQLEQALAYYQRAAEAKERGNNPGRLVITLQAIADVQVRLGQVTEAQQVYERCLALLRDLPAPGEPDQLASIYHSQGRTYERQKQYAQALEAYEQAVQLLDAEREPQLYGVVLHDIADVYEAQGQLGRALEYYQLAAEAKERGKNRRDLVTTLRTLAEVQLKLGKQAEAVQVYERCLDFLRGQPAPGELAQLAGVLVQLGRIYLAQAQPEGALPYLEEARSLVMAEGVATAEEVLSVLALLATTYKALGRQEEVAQVRAAAQALSSTGQQDEAIASLERQLAAVYHSQGRTYERQKQYVQALEAYGQALELLDADKEPQFYGVILHDIGDIYRAQDKREQALHSYQQAAEYKEHGQKPADLVTTLQAQAEVQVELGQETEALEVYERCVQLLQAHSPPGDPGRLAQVLVVLGQLYLAQVHPEAALASLEEARTLVTSVVAISSQELLVILNLLVTVYTLLGRDEEVAHLQAEIRSLMPEGQEVEPVKLAPIYHAWGRFHARQKQYTQALEAYEQALSLLDGEQEPQFYGVVLHDLGDVCRAQGEREHALDYYQRAAEAKERGENRRDLVTTLQALADVQLALKHEAEALASYERCLDFLRGLSAPGDPKRLVKISVLVGQVYLSQAHPERALSYLEEVRTLVAGEGVSTPQEVLVILLLLATTYKAIGREEEAAQAQAEAQALSSAGQQDETMASLERQMATFYHSLGRGYEERDEYEKALEAYQQALQMLDAEQETHFYGVVLHDIGDVYEAQQQLEQAIEYYQRAVKAKERGDNPGSLVITLQVLAEVELELGWEAEALQTLEQCAQLLQALPAPGEPARLTRVYHRQGRLYEKQKQYEKALKAYQQALQLLDLEHEPQFYGIVLHDIGDVYQAQEQLEQALDYYQRAARFKEQGNDPNDLVITLRVLAEMQLALKQEAEALQVLKKCLDLLRGLPAPGEPKRLAGVVVLLGQVYLAQGQPEAALPYLEEARSLVSEEGVAALQEVLVILALLVRTYAALGREEEAVQTQAAAQALLPPDQVMAPTDQQRMIVYHRLGRAYEQEGKHEEALKTYQQGLQLLDVEQEPQVYGVVLHDIADVYRAQGKPEEAVEYYQRAAASKERGNHPGSLVSTLRVLAEVQVELEQETEALQVLKKGMQLLRELPAPGEPRQLAGMLVLLGQIYLAQAQPETALPYLEEARNLMAEEGVASLEEVLGILALLITIYRALGREEEVAQMQAQAQALLPADQVLEPVSLAVVYHRQGRAYEERDRYEEALEAYRQALQLLDVAHDPQTYGVVLHDIADIYRTQEQFKQALAYYQQAAEAKERGDDPGSLIATLRALADLQVKLGQVIEAQQVYERCLDLLRGLPAPGEPDQLARVYHRLGRLHERQEQYEEALEAYQQALQWLDADKEPQFYGVVLHDIGDTYEAEGQLEQALGYYQRAAEAKERGNSPSDLVTTLQVQADVQMELGQTMEALQVYERCLDLLRAIPAPGKPKRLVEVLVLQGQIYLAEAQPEKALLYLEEARTLATEEGAATPQERLAILALLMRTYTALGREEEAAEAQAQVRALLPSGQVTEPTEQQRAIIHQQLGRFYEQEEQYEEALEAYEQALGLLDAEQEPQVYGVVLHDIGDVFQAQGHLEQALEYYQRAVKAKERGDNTRDLITTLRVLADMQVALGQETEALQVLEKGRQLLRELPAPGDPKRLAGVLVLLGQIYLAQDQPETALPYMEEARTLIAEERGVTSQEQLGILTLLATTYVALGQIKQAAQALLSTDQQEQAAVSLYTKALEIYQQALQLLDAEHEPQTYGKVLHGIGYIYQVQGELEQALRYYQQAREAKMRGENRIDLVITLQALANVQLHLGQVAEALSVYQECLALLGELPPSEEFQQSQLRPNDPGIHMQVARCQEVLNSWAEALDTYKLLEGILLEEFRQEPNPTALRRLAWTKYKMGTLDTALELAKQVTVPEGDRDKARSRLIAASIEYIRGNSAAAREEIGRAVAGGQFDRDLMWEVRHDLTHVVRNHATYVDPFPFFEMLFNPLRTSQMDLATLTRQVINILVPVIPYLSSTETSVARKIGEDVYQQSQKLYEVIYARFAKEPDDKASKTLQTFVDDPDFSSLVEMKLQHLVKEDAAFAETLRQIILAGPRQTLTIEEEAQVRMMRMTNKTGIGTQEIRGTKGSSIENVQINIE